jgi:hypothetical protein
MAVGLARYKELPACVKAKYAVEFFLWVSLAARCV